MSNIQKIYIYILNFFSINRKIEMYNSFQIIVLPVLFQNNSYWLLNSTEFAQQRKCKCYACAPPDVSHSWGKCVYSPDLKPLDESTENIREHYVCMYVVLFTIFVLYLLNSGNSTRKLMWKEIYHRFWYF